ncbi:unnamed protein product [Prorocentrum cordatum]|uniref:C3H1-type domain-containing protein n=1 Tax=Prorocentrum cordatum TaxID=2364126 RepID=A0ABN9WUJ9_9DINO|nr:unnamed protein product [Polarella glacialis]
MRDFEGSYGALPGGEQQPYPWLSSDGAQATLTAPNPPDRRDERFRAQFLKSQLCKFYETGCSRGDACEFAHGLEELQAGPDLTKTSLCRAWQAGRCRLSSEECSFAHGFDDLRVTDVYHKSAPCKMFAMGRCKFGKRCRHAHSVSEMRAAMGRSAAGHAQGQQEGGLRQPLAPRPPQPSQPEEALWHSTAAVRGGPRRDAERFPAPAGAATAAAARTQPSGVPSWCPSTSRCGSWSRTRGGCTRSSPGRAPWTPTLSRRRHVRGFRRPRWTIQAESRRGVCEALPAEPRLVRLSGHRNEKMVVRFAYRI